MIRKNHLRHSRESGVTLAAESVDEINADAIVLAGRRAAFVELILARRSCPSRFADAFVFEHSIDAEAVLAARIRRAEVLFDLATFAGEAGRTFTDEVVHEVSAGAAEEARIFSAIVDVRLAIGSCPAGRAVALVAAVFEGNAERLVVARGLADRTRIDGDVARGAFIAGSAETVDRSGAGQVLTHRSFRTNVRHVAFGLFDFALKARIAGRTFARVALRTIDARAAVVAGAGAAFVHVRLAELARKAGRTIAGGLVVLSEAEAAVLADGGITLDGLTRFGRHLAGQIRFLVGRTTNTLRLAVLRLVEVCGTFVARLETRLGVRSRSTFRLAAGRAR